MPFKVVTTTTVVHTGPPNDSTFKIHLEDGTVLTGTDVRTHFAGSRLALHDDFLPDDIRQLVEAAYQLKLDQELAHIRDTDRSSRNPMELAKSRVCRDSFKVVIEGDLKVGAPFCVMVHVVETGRAYGQVAFGTVVRLEGSP
jgi:hypothetical protein